jgi:hypothetical protein
MSCTDVGLRTVVSRLNKYANPFLHEPPSPRLYCTSADWLHSRLTTPPAMEVGENLQFLDLTSCKGGITTGKTWGLRVELYLLWTLIRLKLYNNNNNPPKK